MQTLTTATWPPLTRTMDDPTSPVRRFVNRVLLVDREEMRILQRDYRDGAGDIRVLGSGSNPGTIGTAFDIMLRFAVDPAPDTFLVARGATAISSAIAETAVTIISRLGAPSASGPPATQPLWRR